jgi:hypothetical protein
VSAGSAAIRLSSLKGTVLNPAKGNGFYYDYLVKAINDAGIHIVAKLDNSRLHGRPTPPAAINTDGSMPNPKFPANGKTGISTLRMLVSPLLSGIKYWIVWNEPNHKGF